MPSPDVDVNDSFHGLQEDSGGESVSMQAATLSALRIKDLRKQEQHMDSDDDSDEDEVATHTEIAVRDLLDDADEQTAK